MKTDLVPFAFAFAFHHLFVVSKHLFKKVIHATGIFHRFFVF